MGIFHSYVKLPEGIYLPKGREALNFQRPRTIVLLYRSFLTSKLEISKNSISVGSYLNHIPHTEMCVYICIYIYMYYIYIYIMYYIYIYVLYIYIYVLYVYIYTHLHLRFVENGGSPKSMASHWTIWPWISWDSPLGRNRSGPGLLGSQGVCGLAPSVLDDGMGPVYGSHGP